MGRQMAELLRLFCPIDGLQIATRNVVGQQKADMEDDTIREHDEFVINQPFTCANGHTWNLSGDIEIRISPDTGL